MAKKYLGSYCFGLIFALIAVSSFAATPKFTIIPTTITQLVMPINGQFTVKYTVTNTTNITRTLTMVPIQGVVQSSNTSGSCPNPFTLAHNQSCTLTLTILGSEMPPLIYGGPEVCKTKIGSNTPDPFLCSQASFEHRLYITRTGSELANISVSPSSIVISANNTPGVTVTITNHSQTVTALNVSTVNTFPDLSITFSPNCAAIKPGASCTMTVVSTSGSEYTQPRTINIQGTNTNVTTLSVLTVNATISATPTSLNMITNSTYTINVTNTSQGTTAKNVALKIPTTWTDVTVNNGNCQSIPPGQTCTIIIQTGNTTYAALTTDILGSNTNEVKVSLSVSRISISVNPTTIVVTANSPTGTTVIITNNSPTVTALGVGATSPWADVTITTTGCASILPLGTCTMTFTSTTSTPHGQQTVTIQGTNTAPTYLNVSVADNVNAPLVISGSPAVLAPYCSTGTSTTLIACSGQVITATNPVTNSFTVTNVTATGLPSYVTATYSSPSSSTTCATLSPGQTCTITLTPASTSVATAQTPFTISGTGTSSETAYFQIITVGSNYQGGIIFAIFNGQPLTGQVAATADNSTSEPWGNPVTTATQDYQGNVNTQTIVTAEGAGSYAAYLCYNYNPGTYTDWYLPAVCQISSNTEFGSVLPCGNQTVMYSFLSSNYYWSSTYYGSCNHGSICAWETIGNTPSGGVIAPFGYDLSVRCARNFTA